MKRNFTKMLAALTLLAFLMPALTAWGQTRAEELAYTFATAQSSSNTAYATNYDITVNGISWSCPGNQNFSGYVRIGGKSLSNTDRKIYSKAAIASENASFTVSKIVINHNGISNANLTVNSVKVEVANNSSFSNIIETITLNPSFSVNTAGTITFTPTKTWSSTNYFRFTFNVSNSKSSNYGLDVNNIRFYKEVSAYTITAQSNNADYGTVSIEGTTITATPNSGYRVSTSNPYTVSPSGSATVSQSGNTFTVTPTANTTVTINFEALPTYTVTLGDDSSTLTETTGGTGVTLPTRSDIGDYTFAGWSETNVSTETTTAPTIIAAGEYHPTANITLYPIYTRTEGGANPTAYSVGDTGDYAIVAEINGTYYALPTNPTITSGKITGQVITVSEKNNVKFVSTTNASGFTWTIASAANGYTLHDGNKYIYHSNGGTSGTNLAYGTEADFRYWSFTQDGNYVKMVASYNINNNRGMLFSGTTIGGYSLSNWGATGYYKTMILPICSAGTTYYLSSPNDSYPITITGYGANNANSNVGYYLIASPMQGEVTVASTGLATGTYDFYKFDQTGGNATPGEELEWVSYKPSASSHPFNTMQSGTGYLYANQSNTTITFTGFYNTNGQVSLSYTAGHRFSGWNLIGNPLSTEAYINRLYYRMNSDRDGLVSVNNNAPIAVCEGIFVVAADADDSSVTFTTTPQGGKNAKDLVLNVVQHRGSVIDNVRVCFGEDVTMRKLMLNQDATKIYVPIDGEEYSVVGGNSQGEVPVSFKAEKNGTYTLNASLEDVEFSYLHLIDNMTGADVDLLATPSYTFEARTNDYASRFRILFNATGIEENDATASASFAYYNGSEWVVNGNGTLHVIDMMGRMLSSNDSSNGQITVSANGMAPGVYVLRLINGENIKTQKIIIR